MLYDISGEYPVALGQVSCSSGMSGGAVHSDPLWSPDGSRVAVTSTGRTIDAGMSFSFPIGPLPPELTHQKEGGLSGLTFAALNPEYQMGDAVGYPRCVPLAWSEDGLSLQYSWAWADTEGQLHEGTAWYCFDENGRFTESGTWWRTMCTPCMGEAATKRFLMPLTFSTGRSGARKFLRPASVFISRSGQTGYCMLFSYAWIIFLLN